MPNRLKGRTHLELYFSRDTQYTLLAAPDDDDDNIYHYAVIYTISSIDYFFVTFTSRFRRRLFAALMISPVIIFSTGFLHYIIYFQLFTLARGLILLAFHITSPTTAKTELTFSAIIYIFEGWDDAWYYRRRCRHFSWDRWLRHYATIDATCRRYEE